jgi:REP element-mobilizing transposase RayT
VKKKIRAICEWKRIEILEITIMAGHVHVVAIIPPKLAVSETMGIVRANSRSADLICMTAFAIRAANHSLKNA